MTLGRQFQQLQMFMKPSEITAQPDFRFGDQYNESTAEMRQRKLSQADSKSGMRAEVVDWQTGETASLAEQIKSEGVVKPVYLQHGVEDGPVLADGHHRFFTQERRERQGEEVYLPVKHGGY